MKIQKKNNVFKRYRNVLLLLGMSGAVIGGVGTSLVASALTNHSPDRNNVATGPFTGGVSHLLKYERVANVKTLKTAIYYPRSSGGETNGDKLSIKYGHNNPSKKCFIAQKYRNKGNAVITFRTVGGTASDAVRYEVPMKNMCWDRVNRNNSSTNKGNNRFFANYPLPRNMSLDAGSGMYKVFVTIEYDSDVQMGTSQDNTVNFVPEVLKSNNNDQYQAKMGVIGGDRSNAFGLRSARTTANGVQADRYNVRASTEFGVPCNVTDNKFAVKLYDVDRGVFGDTHIWVTERKWSAPNNRWETTKLPESRYKLGGGDSQNVRWDPGAKAYSALAESKADSFVSVNNAKRVHNGKRVTYQFYVRNTVTDRKVSPVNNVLSVGIPYDSIYADVNCNYDFEPKTNLSSDTYRYYPNLNVTGIIEKQGGVAPENHPWQIFVVKYNNAPSTLNLVRDAIGENACDKVPSTDLIVGSCARIHNATTRNNAEKQINFNEGGPDTPGTRTCFFTRIKDPTDDDTPPSENHWRYSDMVCAKSGIKPKLQVWGGDLQVGGTIKTSLTRNKNDMKLFGAWAEYGVFANGTNTNMASGSGLLGGTTDSAPDRNMLTFSNDGTFGNFGGLTPPSFQGTVESLSHDATNTCSIGPKNFGRNTKKVYYCDGTLVIGGNQRYVGTYSNINQIPNVKLVARDVVVEANVSQIDTGIVALNVKKDANDEASKVNDNRGRLSTCGAVNRIQSGNKRYFLEPDQVRINNSPTAGLRLGPCNTRLTFNGPISVNQLFAYRTNEASLGTPAEIFNLRADNFLSAYGGRDSSETPVARTVNITELPPRF